MYTHLPTGAMLVDARTAMAIMDYVLHGSSPSQPPKPFITRRYPKQSKHTLVTPTLPLYPCLLDSIMLQKPVARPAPTPLPQVTVPPPDSAVVLLSAPPELTPSTLASVTLLPSTLPITLKPAWLLVTTPPFLPLPSLTSSAATQPTLLFNAQACTT